MSTKEAFNKAMVVMEEIGPILDEHFGSPTLHSSIPEGIRVQVLHDGVWVLVDNTYCQGCGAAVELTDPELELLPGGFNDQVYQPVCADCNWSRKERIRTEKAAINRVIDYLKLTIEPQGFFSDQEVDNFLLSIHRDVSRFISVQAWIQAQGARKLRGVNTDKLVSQWANANGLTDPTGWVGVQAQSKVRK